MLTANNKPLRRIPPEPASIPIGTLQRQYVDLDCGRVAYLRHGTGPPLLLVHGIPTSCRLWEQLLGTLGERYDCIAPDLLGLGRSAPKAGADLSSPGQVEMLTQLLDALGIDATYAVFHDQGGAHGQQLLKRHGERVKAVVFTDVVCYDNWLVPMVAIMMWLAGHRLIPVLGRLGLLQMVLNLHTLPLTIVRGKFPAALRDDWLLALRQGGQLQRDWIRYVLAQSPNWTLDAVPALQAWTKPTRVIWAAHDRFLPPSWGLRLAQDIPGSPDDVKLLPFAGHFWQAEVPQTGARAILEFFDQLTDRPAG
ncbi:MAG TPA: alpha/beta hydrolase [Mycobacterium sp.]